MEKLGHILKDKKGVAGLDLALSVIAMLFVIGLLVMIYALMGAEVQDTTSVAQELGGTVANETLATVGESGVNFANRFLPAAACTLQYVTNVSNSTHLAAGNYTYSNCYLRASADAGIWNNSEWNVTYLYTYGGTSWQVINDTNSALSETPEWFPIVIVITFMVVLILLTVMIIRAIRGSGLMVGEGA